MLVDVPVITSLDEDPGEFEATLIGDGTKTPIRIERLHTLPAHLERSTERSRLRQAPRASAV